jgi:microcystin-dependent protein
VERLSYPDLFDIIQTDWGAGNGTTTFNIPDLMDKAITPTGKSRSCVYIIRAM